MAGNIDSVQQFIDFSLKRNYWGIDGGRSDLSVLVLGSGEGATCRYLASMGFRVWGIDIIEPKKSFDRPEKESFQLVCANFCDENPLSQKFDVIVDDHLIHCLITEEDRRAYMRNVKKYLVEGGKFFFETAVWDKHLQFPDGFLFDESEYLLFTKQKDLFIPIRKIPPAHRLEQNLLEEGFTIGYFSYHADLKFFLKEDWQVNEKSCPSILRVFCHL